jgi:5S rRNA maturation endonuclease (ribonuclease M5)
MRLRATAEYIRVKTSKDREPLEILKTEKGDFRLPKGLVRALRELREEDAKVLVEGRRDQTALSIFGIESTKVSEKRLEDFSKDLQKESRLILLFDSDRGGRKLTRKYSEFFPKKTIRIYMKRLYPYCEGRIENLRFVIHNSV